MTTLSALQKLLKYPHSAVFDKSAAGELAMRIQHADGASWVIADEVMTVEAGDLHLSFDLAQHTFGTLKSELVAAGFDVPLLSVDWGVRSALSAVEGRGRQSDANGDHIYAYTSLLWVLLSGHAAQTRDARHQVGEALKQMVLTQSEGQWLDVWGSIYGVIRRAGESDEEYAERIPREAFRVRVNALAIEKAIKEDTGHSVIIEEPWGQMFRLDDARLSSSSKFFDGKNVGYHLLRPVSSEFIDWGDVLAVIDRNRAAGVIVLPPEIRAAWFVDASIEGTVWAGCENAWSVFIPFASDNRLDYMRLSDTDVTINWLMQASELRTYSNTDELANPESITLRRTFSVAGIVLSDGYRLDDENTVFARSELTQESADRRVSDDLRLSSVDQKPARRPVDIIRTDVRGLTGDMDMGGPEWFSGLKPSVIIGRLIRADVDGTIWIADGSGFDWDEAGGWGDFPWGATQQDVNRVELVFDRLYQFVNVNLPERVS